MCIRDSLQSIPGKFGKFIQKEHPVVGQTDFPGAGVAATARDGRRADAVVGTAEGPMGQQPLSGAHQTCHRIDGGGFQRLIISHRRQNARHPLGQHALAGAGRPHHQQIVTARRRHFHGPPGLFLTPDVGQVRPQPVAIGCVTIAASRAEQRLPGEMLHHLPSCTGAIDRHPFGHRGLRCVFRRDKQSGCTGPGSRQCHGQHTGHRAQRSVQPQFPQKDLAGLRNRDQPLGGQNPQKDRKIIDLSLIHI